jgi:proline dehydrogenase
MRLLDDAHWVARTYRLVDDSSEMLEDLEIIKKTLPRVISKSHLATGPGLDFSTQAGGRAKKTPKTAAELDALLPSILHKAFKGELEAKSHHGEQI